MPGRRAAGRSAAILLGLSLLLAGCTGAGTGSEQPPSDAGGGTASAATQEPQADPALQAACTTFWGDPDYVDPLSRTVLARAASAAEAGPDDPDFFALMGDDIEGAFEGAPSAAQQSAETLAQWFRTEPERGADADLEAFRTAWHGVAGDCREVSPAALWALAPGEDGTKPAALVCADVFDTPGTLTHFANANVLTSNMFKLVGLQPREVPVDRQEDVQDTADLLAVEINAVDDDAVGAALEQVRAPFADALAGDIRSEGLSGPLTELGTACEAAGYSSPDAGEIDDRNHENDEADAVVGASAEGRTGTNHGGRS
ncbi:hypothetical protein [Brachybacterium ginsengisoli]|uniref:hypothetical protein n=1 Tax=Brachybacterium ginsengisoli TaxID=1331682 RepID=UPI001D131E56|nr:hypothetical protein [Brachybacterium ginsengisoli]